MRVLNLKTLALLMGLLLAGCAKELPQELPDSVQPNVFDLNTIKSGSVNIMTQSAPSSKAIQVADKSISGIFALNEKGLYPINVISDTTGLGKLFEKLEIESSGPGQIYKVKFKIAHESLVAYIERPDASLHMLDLIDSSNMLPLFEYPISNFGIIEVVKNALGEATRDLTFTPKSKTVATHIMLEPTIEKRSLAGLRNLDVEERVKFLTKKELENKILTLDSIKTLFPNSNFFEDEKIIGSKFKLQIFKDRLYFLQSVEHSKLNAIEKIALKANADQRIYACDESEAIGLGLVGDDCFFHPVAYLPLTHVKIERLRDVSGETLAEPNIVEGVNRNSSRVIKVDLNEKITEGKYFKEDSFRIRYHEKDSLHLQNLTIAEVKQQFPNHAVLDLLPSTDIKIVKLFIFKNNLYLLIPSMRKDLNPVEKLALIDSEDPRIFNCEANEASLNNVENEQCVWKPFARLGATHVKVVPKLEEDEYSLYNGITKQAADERGSNAILVDHDDQINLDYIGENIFIRDQIFTSKKVQYDTTKRYIYVPMSLGTPREVPAAAPFVQGNERIVYMKWVKEGLQIFEKDKEFNTSINEKPVLTIGGKFLDFKCKDENDANCQALEVIDHEVTEEKARFFIPDLENVSFAQTNTLDLYYLDSDPCVITQGKRLVDYTIKKGLINFQIEKEYKLSDNFSCVIDNFYADTTNFNGLATTGFKVQYYYSVMDMEQLVSKDYEPVNYPEEDHNIFGFFKDREEKLKDDFSDTTEDYYLSRWNPKKKTIVYHLSDSYNEPDQKLIKQATYDSVAQINKALRNAEAGIQIELKEPSGKLPGDLRYNVLQLITDPLDNGLLGYAPTVTNPETGEIIQGHINMYAGVLRSTSSWVWDQMIQLTQDKLAAKEQDGEVIDIEALLEDTNLSNAPSVSTTSPTAATTGAANTASRIHHSNPIKIKPDSKKLADLFVKYHQNFKIEQTKVKSLVKKMKKYQSQRLLKTRPVDRRNSDELNELEKRLKFYEDRLDFYAKNNAYSVEAFKIGTTVKELLPGIDKIAGVFKADGTLKEWNDLSSAQRKEAMDIIVVYSYVSTFVHEFGHNLGLRHNFSGSFDKDNFYTKDEMQKMWPKSLSLKVPAYSSIMDYAFSALNEATVFGKYDIAALRFAYARKLQTESGKSVPIVGSLRKSRETYNDQASALEGQAAQLREAGDEPGAIALEEQAKEFKMKDFAYCTDENAGTSLTCDRFDEGTSLTEIVQHKIDKYKSYYKYRNLRRDKKEFSQIGLGGYLISRFFEFIDIRKAFEEWEAFVEFLSPELMVAGCTPDLFQQYPDFCAMIEDRKVAVNLAADFFLDVIKEPEASCVTMNQADPSQGIQIKTLFSIYDEVKFDMDYAPLSCYDPAITNQLASNGEVVLAEAGRYLNSFNDFNPKFTLTTDIAVRGVWIDKLLAMKSLFQRKESIFSEDNVHMAMIDHPEIAEKVNNVVKHMILGEPLQNGTLFKDNKGNKYRVNYSLQSTEKITAPHPFVSWVSSFLGIPESGKADITRALLKNAYSWGLTTPDRSSLESSLAYMNQFAVYKWDRSETFNSDGLAVETLKGISYGGSPEDNSFTFEILQNSQGLNFLQTVDPTLIAAVLQRRTTKPYCETPPVADPVADPATDSDADSDADSDTDSEDDTDLDADPSVEPSVDTEPEPPVTSSFCIVKATNEELAWDVEEPLLSALIQLRSQGVPLTVEQLTPQFGEQKAKELISIYELEAFHLQTILLERVARQSAPQGASEEEQILYDLTTIQLQDFLNGTLEAKVQNQLPKLELLPEIYILQ